MGSKTLDKPLRVFSFTSIYFIMVLVLLMLVHSSLNSSVPSFKFKTNSTICVLSGNSCASSDKLGSKKWVVSIYIYCQLYSVMLQCSNSTSRLLVWSDSFKAFLAEIM
ncbi:hypothetical protein HOLleu_04335 [Holothuria leucospilota]|uniref:Uncharacterized protein n=1 Tax=Holothuria leucospilota TaxID=206669 RepID=A0A9Q1CTQ8_HOLLE|nr:hypothetical protein HOLleu_04335 [Holothuria leucospilota]